MRRVFLVLFLVFAAGCASKSELSSLFPAEVWLAARPLPVAPDDLQEPLAMLCTGGLLVTTNFRTPHLLRIYDLGDGRFRDLIPRGRGAAELLTATSMWASEDSLRVYDIDSRRVWSAPLARLFDDDPHAAAAPAPVRCHRMTSCGTRTGRRLVLAASEEETDGDLLRLLDGSGCETARFGAFGLRGRAVAPCELPFVFQGEALADGFGRRIVYASSFGCLFRFYATEDFAQVRLLRAYDFGEPLCSPASDPQSGIFSVRWHDDCPSGTLALTGDENRCYALCEEGKRLADEEWRAATVCEFDWEGNPCRLLRLDRPVQTIACDREGRRLVALALRGDGGYELLAYPL